MSTVLVMAHRDQTIDEVDRQMLRAEIRHVPVVDASGHLVGVVSDRDLARALSKLGRGSVRVGSVMTEPVVTAGESTPIADAIELMLEHKIGCLPVIGDGGALVGIVTETDCLRVALSSLRDHRGPEPTDYRA